MTIEQLKEKMPWIDVTEWLQHSNGGGWKHRTAIVPDTVKVPRDASIGDRASIGYRASIGDDMKSVLCIQASGHQITTCVPTRDVQIGCYRNTIEWWLQHYEAVGQIEYYTSNQIAEYGALLLAVKAWLDINHPNTQEK